MRRDLALVAIVGALGGAGCRASDESTRDTMTGRQRDSVIGASTLPGATGVSRAIGATDSAAARNARLDSLGRQP